MGRFLGTTRLPLWKPLDAPAVIPMLRNPSHPRIASIPAHSGRSAFLYTVAIEYFLIPRKDLVRNAN